MIAAAVLAGGCRSVDGPVELVAPSTLAPQGTAAICETGAVAGTASEWNLDVRELGHRIWLAACHEDATRRRDALATWTDEYPASDRLPRFFERLMHP